MLIYSSKHVYKRVKKCIDKIQLEEKNEQWKDNRYAPFFRRDYTSYIVRNSPRN